MIAVSNNVNAMSDIACTSAHETAKHLVTLCRTGRLYELERWIADGNSLDISVAKQGSLLQVAVETGFHSLIELIVRHETDQSSKNTALADAVSQRRLDYVQLLVENGAEPSSLPFAEVLMSWDPKIIRFFMDHGADLVEGSPFSVAFGQKIRTALRPFMESKRAHPELIGNLQEQASCALRYFCYKGDLKWVSLMLWAGADSRSLGSSLEDLDKNDPEYFTTAMEQAGYSGSVEVLKKLKLDPDRDNLSELLHRVATSGHLETVGYLLEIGAKPNDKPNGGSSALDGCMWRLYWGDSSFYYKSLRSKYDVSKGLECARELLAHGASWNPNDRDAVNSLRRALYGCEPDVTIELLQIFMKHNACPKERLVELLRTPRMKEHLAAHTLRLQRLGLQYREKRTPAQEQMPPAHLLRQYDRAKLHEQMWSEPARNVARHYGFSDVRLGKVCKLLRVPVPGRGYWAKKCAGKPTRKRPPLPPLPNE